MSGLTMEGLEAEGSTLAQKAINEGLKALTDDQAKTLSLYADWKDGEDWEFIEDNFKTRYTFGSKSYLIVVYGYSLEPQTQTEV